jgi:hypothetical protein
MSRKPEDSGETPLISPFPPVGQFQTFQGFAEVFARPLRCQSSELS